MFCHCCAPGLNLLDRLEHNADHDDQARSSERYGSVEHASEEERKNTDDRKADRADENDVVEDPVQIIARRLAGTNTRNEAAALFQIISNLQRIESDRRIEVCEENKQSNIYDQSQCVFDLSGIAPVGRGKIAENLRPDSCSFVTGQCGDDHRELHKGGSEDDGHNASRVNLERYHGVSASDKSSSLDLLGVLYRNPSLGIVKDDYHNNHKHDDSNDDHCSDRADRNGLSDHELRE